MTDQPKSPPSLRAQAQTMSSLALETLEAIMRGGGQDSVRLAAAREVLDRGHGKPKPATRKKAKAPKAAAPAGMTVVIKRFTDAPDPEAGEYEERP